MDEPTTGLDPVNARHIKNLILEQRARGATVFFTTHDMTVADELCDRVAFIAGGRIEVIDAPSTLKKQFGKRSVVVAYIDGAADAKSRPDQTLRQSHLPRRMTPPNRGTAVRPPLALRDHRPAA